MVQIRVNGHANMGQLIAQFKAVEAQVEKTNTALAQTAMIPMGGTIEGFNKLASAASVANRAWDNALASSGAFRVEQLKLNDVINKNTELLTRQKLSFRETFGKQSKKMMRDIYMEQLRMQQSFARITDTGISDGKTKMSLAVPTEVHKSWDTLDARVGMFRARLASASAELINWGKNTQWAGRQLMAGITFPIAAFGAAAGVMAYEVDKQLTRITKVYDTAANQNSHSLEEIKRAELELKEVREAGMNTAVNAAKQYGAAVTQTLEVQAELAATGQTGNRLQESTTQVMRIATLGEIEHAEATKALISLQSVLGLTVNETADAFNYMNSIENATSLSTQDFVAAIPRALGPMKEMGGSLQDLALLMVAMKERGIEAGEGANAIKAMMQRLYRPSRQVREEWQAIAKVDPLKFVEESGGNVMEILPRIAEVTRDLDQASRVKLLAGLFGTYQVTRMSAMLKGLDDLNNGIGQTTRVLEVNQQSAKEWADTAENELATQAESAAGRFKRAWEGIRAEMAAIGDPFLDVASKFLKVTSAVLGFFNNMPSWIKKAAIFAAIFGAIIGPIVMLIGLFANFAGNIGKFGAFVLKFASSFEVLNKAQWATRIQAKLAEKGFLEQATAAEVLEAQLKGVGMAAEAAAVAISQAAGIPLTPELTAAIAARQEADAAAKKKVGRAPVPINIGGVTEQPTQRSNKYYGGRASERVMQEQALLATMERERVIAQQLAIAERDRLHNQVKSEQVARAQVAVQEKTAASMRGAAVGAAAMASSMILLTGALGEGGQQVGQWLMLATIVVPAAKMLAPLMRAAATAGWTYAASQITAAKASAGAATGTLKLAAMGGKMKTLGAVVRGIGVGFTTMLGPIGIAATGILGIAAAVKYFKGKHDEMVKSAIANQKALNATTQDWADILGVAARERRELSTVASYKNDEKSISQLADEFAGTASGEAIVKAYKDADSAQAKSTIALSQYLQVLRETNANSVEARKALQIMFVAAGDGAIEAARKADEFYNRVGNIADTHDMAELWREQFLGVTDEVVDAAETTGVEIGKVFADAIVQGNPEDQMNAMLDSISTGWVGVIGDMTDTSRELLETAGIDETNVQNIINDWKKVVDNEMSEEQFLLKFNLDDADFSDIKVLEEELSHLYSGTGGDAEKLRLAEKGIVKELSSQLGISRELATLAELRNTLEWQLAFANKAQGREIYKQLVLRAQQQQDIALGFLGTQKDLTDEQKLQILNTVRFGMGLSAAESLSEGLRDNTKKAADEAGRLKKNLNGITVDIRMNQVPDLLKAGMEGAVNEYADAISKNFDSAMERSLDNNQSYWDNAIERMQAAQERSAEAMENRHERIMDAFDERWERRKERIENYYDKRIEAIDKEIEAEQKAEEERQRIFEAEQARLNRLTEAANRTIDFNMALQTGELDEAAKIANDMDAAAQEWALADAGEAAARRADRRRERLEKKGERLEGKRDRVLERLEEQEEARREALEKRLEMEKRHLEKVQEARLDALKAEADANQKALRENWEARRENLNDQLDLFKSFIPKNMKQLKQWIGEMHGEFKNFGTGTLNPLSDKWGRWFKQSFNRNMREAGAQTASSNMWEGISGQIALKILKGMGFQGMKGVEKFIRTGKLPKNFDAGRVMPDTGSDRYGRGDELPVFHRGGEIGGRGSGRAGVARTAGLHPSEQLILARQGEFMVNRDSYKKHQGLIEAVNDGTFDADISKNGNIMGGATGIAGPIMGIAAMMLSVGIGRAIQNAVIKKYMQTQSGVGPLGNITPGKYGDLMFDAEQLRNASIISSVGKSMGMSGRDLAIGIMTAITESGLRNVNYGDRDSLGLFQQRPSMGWGTPEQVTNPEYAARKFFEALKGVTNRGSLSPWMAAQTVQRSAFADGSNYRQYWDEGQAIFKALMSSGTGGGYMPGPGGRSKPIKGYSHGGIHDTSTGYPAVDFAAPEGTPIYAVASGVISRYDELRGYEPRNAVQNGFYSYGKVLYLKTDAGPTALYAHLSQAHVREGQRVAGGAKIAASGNTGYSTGPHLHFGATNGPLAWLKTGGMTLNDGIAMLHRGETVLTKPLSEDLQTTIKAFGKTSQEILSGRRGGDRENQIGRLKAWANGQIGKPYVLGGIGPGGYDCSGLQSAIVSMIKGWGPHERRLFYTGNMGSILPGLGFKRGNGGNNDYSVGWYTGNPGHTSGRIGNMGIESTGDHVRGGKDARPVASFPNQMHIPLRGATSPEPKAPDTGSDNKKDKTKKEPWSPLDKLNSSAESWGKETVKADPYSDTGFWTYLSGTARKAGIPKPKAPQGPGGGDPSGSATTVRTGTYNVFWGTSNQASQRDLTRLMGMTDILSLQELGQSKRALIPWIQQQGWGFFGPSRGVGLAWNKNNLSASNTKLMKLSNSNQPHNHAAYGKFTPKGGGRAFWQVSAHTVPGPQHSPTKRRIQLEQYANLRNLQERLSASGVPVIMGGDFNPGRKGPGFIEKHIGLVSDRDKFSLDHLLYDKSLMKSLGLQVLDGMSSDHPAVVSKFQIPSHKDGAQNVRWDNTLVNMHKKESILTEPQSDKFRYLADNIDKIAMGGGNEYNIRVEVSGAQVNENMIAEKVVQAIRKEEARKPLRRR